MRVLIASGGSGGHIFPAIALCRTLKEKSNDIDIKFIGSDKPLDRRIFEKENFNYTLLSANKLPYKMTFALIIFSIKLLFDFIKSFLIVLLYKPDVVIGFGGYVSGPIIFAAYLLGIPRMVHEQNVVPGRANRILFRLVDKIAISFEETTEFLNPSRGKVFFTGNPIRNSSFKIDRLSSIDRLGLDRRKFTILVIGGSHGAHILNETFIKALYKLDEKDRSSLQVIHITGTKDYQWTQREYILLGLEHRVYSFIDRIEEAYNASDLVVTRSGASAIFEIAFFGRPMILIPYPFAMSHQGENARVFSQKGAAISIDEKGLSVEGFKTNISNLMHDRTALSKMAESSNRLSIPEASSNLAGHLLSLAKRA